jgi:hypothetical protein
MNKHIEHALANQVYSIIMSMRKEPSIVISEYRKDGIHDIDSISSIDLIKEFMNDGVSPLSVIRVFNEPKPLIAHVFAATANEDVLNIFINALKKEDIQILDQKTISKMYHELERDFSSSVQSRFLKKAFELGFDFVQGTFHEVRKAENGDQEFFEICLAYKSDFKLDFKYENDLYLDEIVKADLDSMGNQNPDYKQKENLFIFLKKAREVYTLKTSLAEELPIKNSVKPTNKI